MCRAIATAMGEVVVQSDHVMEGYFRDEPGTEAVMTDGWFHTGDMAVWDEERYIHIVDRKKEIIISGGENISSLEVEKAIFAHPDVFECAVVAAPDEKWGEVPAAIVVLKPGSAANQQDSLRIPAGGVWAIQDAPRLLSSRKSRCPRPARAKFGS